MKLERSAEAPPRRTDKNAYAMAAVLAALWGILAILPATRPVFLTERNLSTLFTQNAHVLVLAVGMTLVILIRGIDLSVGAGVALTGCVAALLQIECGQPAWIAIAAALACGAAIGLWQGLWIARFGIPAFVVTLAGFNAFRGLALVLSHARGLAPMHHDFDFVTATLPAWLTWIAILGTAGVGTALALVDARKRRTLGLEPPPLAAHLGATLAIAAALLFLFASGIPCPVLVAGAVVIGGIVLTRRTRLGRHLYAIGGNPEAARLAGIDVRRVTWMVYVLVGVLTAIAGVLLAGRVNGVTPGSQGMQLELDAVTAVVIGGTSLFGGKGSVLGTVLGTLVFGTLANGMNLLSVDSNWQLIAKGLLLMGAALVDVLSKGKRV